MCCARGMHRERAQGLEPSWACCGEWRPHSVRAPGGAAHAGSQALGTAASWVKLQHQVGARLRVQPGEHVGHHLVLRFRGGLGGRLVTSLLRRCCAHDRSQGPLPCKVQRATHAQADAIPGQLVHLQHRLLLAAVSPARCQLKLRGQRLAGRGCELLRHNRQCVVDHHAESFGCHGRKEAVGGWVGGFVGIDWLAGAALLTRTHAAHR